MMTVVDAAEIVIRKAESPADYVACQQAQKQAWGILDDSYLVPIATMVGAQLHGGLVLGAFLHDGAAVGVSFAFLGRTHGWPCLYSQLTGVVPGYQSLGLGWKLKHAQRDFALETGLPILAWAFDPLQAGNARFNLAKLGASAVRYVPDMYGPRSDALNRGAPTDRLIAEWPSRAPMPSVLEEYPASAICWRLRADNRNHPVVVVQEAADEVWIEIPDSIQTLRQNDAPLAEAWTLAVRAAFLGAFAEGFKATGFEAIAGKTSFAYVLTRKIGMELPYINA